MITETRPGPLDTAPAPIPRVQRAVLVGAAVAYPVLLFFGTTRWAEGAAAAAFLGLAGVLGALALLDARARPPAVAMLLPASLLGLGTLLLSGDALMLAFPTLVSFAVALPFAWSLRPGATPLLIEFARLHRKRRGVLDTLEPANRAHCLRFTRIWTATLVANGALAAGLAIFAERTLWAIYACGISYALLGTLYLVESRMRPSDPTHEMDTNTTPQRAVRNPGSAEQDQVLDADDPWFAGHFDDEPVLPAVAQLAMVAESLQERLPGKRLAVVESARFRRPIRPGVGFRIEFEESDDALRTIFRILAGGELASQGVVRFDG